MAHLHLNELSLICDMWLNKITYLLTYLLIMQLINQFHRARKVNSNVVVLTSVFLRVKFVMHAKIARMVKMNPILVVSVA